MLNDPDSRDMLSSDNPESLATDRRRTATACILIVLAGGACYANSIFAPFIFDDQPAIVDNSHIRSLWPLGRVLTAPPESPVGGRPVVALSLALNYSISGLAPWSYHAFNLLVHLGCAMLVFAVLRRTARQPVFREAWRRRANAVATVIALAFTVHPLQTEAVTYVTQRTELLMAFFLLLTLYSAIRAWRPGERRKFSAVAIGACALGMASKEVMAAAPVLVVLYDRTFFADQVFRHILASRKWLYLGLAGTWLLLAFLVVSEPRADSVGLGLDVTPVQYLQTQAVVLLKYVTLVLWPHPLILSYGWVLVENWRDAAVPGAVILAMLAGSAFAIWRRHWLGFVGAWFFLILAPTSSILPIVTELAAERRMYLPMLAVMIPLTLAIWARATRKKPPAWPLPAAGRRWLAALLAASWILNLGWRTVQRNRDYASPIRMWSQVIAHRPNHPGAHYALAESLLAAGRLDEAAGHYRRVIELHPRHPLPRPRLAALYMVQGRIDEALALYGEAVTIQPDSPSLRNEYGLALARAGRNQEAVASFEAAIRLRPDYAVAHSNLAIVLSSLGQTERAMASLRQAVRIEPDAVDSRFNLGQLLMSSGKLDEAVGELQEASRLAPHDAGIAYALGLAYDRLGRGTDAQAQYRRVLELDPQHADARRRIASPAP